MSPRLEKVASVVVTPDGTRVRAMVVEVRAYTSATPFVSSSATPQ